ncbi:hypothetical protein L1887_51431 [Cichorium endivia]|nr:hypothetical protein L1887_51431 [Cichorium endivia]
MMRLDFERVEFLEQLGSFAVFLDGFLLHLGLLFLPSPHPPLEAALVSEVARHEKLDGHAVDVVAAEAVGDAAVARVSGCIQTALARARRQFAPVATACRALARGEVEIVSPVEGEGHLPDDAPRSLRR